MSKPTLYAYTISGTPCGKRKTNRPYTHVVVVTGQDQIPHALSWHASEPLARKGVDFARRLTLAKDHTITIGTTDTV